VTTDAHIASTSSTAIVESETTIKSTELESDNKTVNADIVNTKVTKDTETMTDDIKDKETLTEQSEVIPNNTNTTTTTTTTPSHPSPPPLSIPNDHVKKLLKVMHVYSRYTSLTQKQLPPTLVYFAQVSYYTSQSSYYN
jgi:hypothetical protein